MAMTKKELAEMESLKTQAAINRALNWTQTITPDVEPNIRAETNGYGFNVFTRGVKRMWSTAIHHGYGDSRETGFSRTQGSKSLYSTELLAYQALRGEMEIDFARALAKVDKEIARLQRES